MMQSDLCREGGPHPAPPRLARAGRFGAFDLALFAALVGDGQSRSRPLGEQTWKAEDIAETIALTLSPVREATSEGFRALKIR